MAVNPDQVLEMATAALGAEEFDRLIDSVPATRRLGRLRTWQEQLLARLPVPVGFEAFVKAFGDATPRSKGVAGVRRRARVWAKKPVAGVVIFLVLGALAFVYMFFGFDLFLSYATRKAQTEAAVAKVLDESGPHRPLPVTVEMHEVRRGSWEGLANIGGYRYKVWAGRTGGEVYHVSYSRME